MRRVRRRLELPLVLRNDSMLTHQTGYPVSATGVTDFIQLRMDSRATISFTALLMTQLDLH